MNIIETYSHVASIADIVANNKTELLRGIKTPLKKAVEDHQVLANEVEAHSYGRAREMWRSAISSGDIDFIKEHKNRESFETHMATLKTAYKRKAEQHYIDNVQEHMEKLKARLVELIEKEITKVEEQDKINCEALSIPFEPSAPARALNRKKEIISKASFSKTGSPTSIIKTLTDHEDFLN